MLRPPYTRCFEVSPGFLPPGVLICDFAVVSACCCTRKNDFVLATMLVRLHALTPEKFGRPYLEFGTIVFAHLFSERGPKR